MYGLSWSPDGSKIAFTDTPGGDEDDADIFIIEINTGKIKKRGNEILI
jgi:Tol biopolymer transport system component